MFPKNRQPTHPGAILEHEFLKPLGMDAKKFAQVLGGDWNEIKINAILTGKEGISERIARDFAEALGTTVEFWKKFARYYQQWEQVHKANEKGSLKPWKKAQ